jgi:hypothetical protein
MRRTALGASCLFVVGAACASFGADPGGAADAGADTATPPPVDEAGADGGVVPSLCTIQPAWTFCDDFDTNEAAVSDVLAVWKASPTPDGLSLTAGHSLPNALQVLTTQNARVGRLVGVPGRVAHIRFDLRVRSRVITQVMSLDEADSNGGYLDTSLSLNVDTDGQLYTYSTGATQNANVGNRILLGAWHTVEIEVVYGGATAVTVDGQPSATPGNTLTLVANAKEIVLWVGGLRPSAGAQADLSYDNVAIRTD